MSHICIIAVTTALDLPIKWSMSLGGGFVGLAPTPCAHPVGHRCAQSLIVGAPAFLVPCASVWGMGWSCMCRIDGEVPGSGRNQLHYVVQLIRYTNTCTIMLCSLCSVHNAHCASSSWPQVGVWGALNSVRPADKPNLKADVKSN
jgi:hypothetical protein